MILVTCRRSTRPGPRRSRSRVACALAEDRDDGPPLLIEVDAAGGDLAARLGLPTDPGLATLAAAARARPRARPALASRQPPAGGRSGRPRTDRSRPSAARPPPPSARGWTRCSTHEAVDAVIDVGRVSDADALGLAGVRVTLVLVACRPDLAGIEHTRRLVRQLRPNERRRRRRRRDRRRPSVRTGGRGRRDGRQSSPSRPVRRGGGRLAR